MQQYVFKPSQYVVTSLILSEGCLHVLGHGLC